MGFCRRCGEIVFGERCKCGGTPKEPAGKALFTSSTADRWSSRYLSKSPSPAHTPSASPSRSSAPAPAPPTSHLKSPSQAEMELSSVFGSVLSPRDNWQCAGCCVKFRQEETIYPHPEVGREEGLEETYFCRDCFAERFSKGVCKKCKCAVLSDAPFIIHDQLLWHSSCYSCTYCSVPTPPSDIIIDFGGNPSCETCFNGAAYKSFGVPPSPHLAQTGRTKVAPAPSRWGRESGGGAAGFGKGGMGSVGEGKGVRERKGVGEAALGGAGSEPGWRVRREREKSPMVASLDELGEKMRKAGLEDRPAVKTSTTVPMKKESPAPASQRWSTRNPPAGTTFPSSSTSTRPRTFSPPASPTRTTLLPYSPSRPPLPTPHLLPRVPGRSVHTSLQPLDPLSKPSPSISTLPNPPHDFKPSLENGICPVCEKELGYGEYIQLQTGEELHRDCFRCGGCGEVLGGGSFVVKEDKTYHKQCAPAPRVYRSIVTSLAEPPIDEERSSDDGAQVEVEDFSCFGCGKELGVGHSITLPRMGRTFHQACFSCANCGKGFGTVPGDRSFVESGGMPYHIPCAPPPTIPARSPLPALRTSTSRALPTPPPAPSPTHFHLPAPPLHPPSIFATRTRPLANLGGLLICAGCSVRATEREMVKGPLGRRYHEKCLRCGVCARGVDSESRVGVEGGLRCEGCRKAEGRRSYKAGIA